MIHWVLGEPASSVPVGSAEHDSDNSQVDS